MKYDFIGIKDQAINGIKNPCVTIVGTITEEKCKFLVLADGKESKYSLDRVNSNGDFALFAPINSKSKIVEVYLIKKNKRFLLCKLKNSLYRRIKHRIYSLVKIRIKRVVNFFGFMTITLYKGIRLAWREYHFLIPPALWPKYYKALKEKIKYGPRASLFFNPFITSEYNAWLDINKNKESNEDLAYKPLISVVIPVYNVQKNYLSDCIDSILGQSYKNFEICIADDCSTNQETLDTLAEYESKFDNIKVVYRKTNGHISKATNSAIKLAKGDFIAFVDNDDTLDENALLEVVKALNNDKKLDFIYTDEDKINQKGLRCDPHFKPDWSPDTFLSLNYMSHLSVVRKKLVEEVGMLATGLEGAQDYDLYLKITEKTNKIYHIPKVLYHWRMVEGSTSITTSNKSYALDKGLIALENALKRRSIVGRVERDSVSGYYKIKYDISKEPLVSIIIPTRDYASTLDICLKSIYDRTKYKNYEIIVVNNDSCEAKTFELFDKYKSKHSNFRVIDAKCEFNYSFINNLAVKSARGDYICLLNNDTEIITDDWLGIMVGYASQEHIGAVGPKLFYPDNTIQHAGVILGLGGVASHAYIGATKTDPGMYGRLRVPYNYACVTAACLVVSKEKYLKVNGLEEDLKVAYNDVDFNIKLLKEGYYNVFLPQVEIYHYESKSRGLDTSPKKIKRFNIEQEYMYKKWNSIIKNDPFYNSNFSKKGWFMLPKKEDNNEGKN